LIPHKAGGKKGRGTSRKDPRKKKPMYRRAQDYTSVKNVIIRGARATYWFKRFRQAFDKKRGGEETVRKEKEGYYL